MARLFGKVDRVIARRYEKEKRKKRKEKEKQEEKEDMSGTIQETNPSCSIDSVNLGFVERKKKYWGMVVMCLPRSGDTVSVVGINPLPR